MSYSPFFEVLYDQKQPVGDFGRGTHYSVLRVPVWQDGNLKPLEQAQLLDFAIVWDTDHDERIVEVVEAMYFRGLLSPVKYLGESKGTLRVLLDGGCAFWARAKFDEYWKAVTEATPGDDPWRVSVDVPEGRNHSIIQASYDDVLTYLRHIELLWSLGLKPHTEHVCRSLAERMAEQRQAMIEAGEARRLKTIENDEIPF